jgi:hypothetical protein
LSRQLLKLPRVPQPTVCWLSGSLRRWLLLAVCFANVFCLAQSKPPKSSSRTPFAQKKYCQQGGGFCFSYPASWTVLGESMGDGVIVAPQQRLDRELWDEVTVAAVVPPPAENQPPTSIDQVIETAMTNMKGSGHDPATLQRQEITVAGLPAQMIRIRYHDDGSGRDWIEQLVFIEGPYQEIYSVALKAQPGTISPLESVFDGIVRSWKLESGESNAGGPAHSSGKTAPPASAPHN